jgi:transcriptional regulator with GAF, ATPase, and Fis domain
MESPPTQDVAQTAAARPGGSGPADYLLCIEGERAWTAPLPASGELVIGRGPDAALRLGDELVSRAHAQILAVPDGIRIADLGSRHGTTVNGQRLAGPRLLASGDVIAIGAALLIVHRPVRASGGRGLLDGPALLRRLEEELERSLRYRREVSLAIVRADAPLDRARVATAMGGRLRLIDAAALLGEREAAVLLPEMDLDEAGALAQALAVAVAGPGGAAGVAVSPGDGVDVDALLSCARAAAASAPAGGVAFGRDTVQWLALGEREGGREIALADPAMLRIYELIKRLARSTLPILISGETGVGKELAAAAVHAYSTRASGPFVSINCAAIPEHLAESELFGHERGAFTGAVSAKPGQLEIASGGTVFLDEIGELPLAVQAKLLRVLETQELQRVGDLKPRTADLRIVAATNRDLAAEVEAGRFRRDLFFRLGAAQVVLPPLRDRPRDLAFLATRMFDAACARLKRRPLPMTVAATQALFLHTWPGNVRELKNAMDYAAAAAPDTSVELDVWHLPPTVAAAARETAAGAGAGAAGAGAAGAGAGAAGAGAAGAGAAGAGAGAGAAGAGAAGAGAAGAGAAGADAAALDPHANADSARTFRPIDDEVRELERKRMIEALAATSGVQNRAAELIQMPLRTFVTKLKRYAIAPADWK